MTRLAFAFLVFVLVAWLAGREAEAHSEAPPALAVSLYGVEDLRPWAEDRVFEGRRWGPLVLDVARRYDVDPALVYAIILTESSEDPLSLGKHGEKGLMQMLPGTAGEYGLSDDFELYQPSVAVDLGTRHLRWLLEVFEGDEALAVAAYNAGEFAVRAHGTVPGYSRRYVNKVLKRAAILRAEVEGELR